MIIGIPKEIKEHEYRVGATPAMVKAFTEASHQAVVEKNAGARIGYTDEMYKKAGAKIAETAQDVYQSEMIIKVKEPQTSEYAFLKRGQILFCFLHLAPDPDQAKALIEKEVVGIAYETVTDDQNKLPLLLPMSEIAGRLSVQAGAVYLQMNHNGKGLLLGGVPGVHPASVVIIGGGVVGTEAARMAVGLGACVTVIDKNLDRLRCLDLAFKGRIKTLYSTSTSIDESVEEADLLIGSVLIPGKKAPKLVTKEMIRKMSPGSVAVDVAIDQGGCFETSRKTSLGDPVFIESGVVHYCVTNMPGACSRTATQALTNATMDYALDIANKGYRQALSENPGLKNGLNVCLGYVTCESVAQDLGYSFTSPDEFL